ncbi:MAG: tetratricopeptide repeat protein [Endomicrobiales bacterium]|nr:tetratricopeptide repeat protein [Endomicrobiales bacterium]
MGFFEKKKTKENNQPKSDLVFVKRDLSIPESEMLLAAKKRAEDDIRALEEKVSSERQSWMGRLRNREDEKISIQAKLEALIRKMDQEKNKKCSKFDLMQKQVERELVQAQEALKREVDEWNAKLSAKDKEIEDTKKRTALAEAQAQISDEDKLRALRADVEMLVQRLKSTERSMLEEQSQWITRIKDKENEIINLKTQLALKETQSAGEEEKDRLERRQAEEAWSRKISEVEKSLQDNRSEYEKSYKSKETELLALKRIMDERIVSANLECEERERHLRALIDKLKAEADLVSEHMSIENAQWKNIMEEKDAELAQLKTSILLRESQDKSAQDKLKKDFAAAESAFLKKLRDMTNRLAEEKRNWQTELANKEEAIKAFKVQAELKIKELWDLQESKKDRAKEEKAAIEKRIEDLKTNYSVHKARWQAEVSAKNDEISSFLAGLQNKEAESVNRNESALKEMEGRIIMLQKELFSAEKDLSDEKTRWGALLISKEAELEGLRNELANREESIKSQIDSFKSQLDKELQPFLDQERSIKEGIERVRKQGEAEVSQKIQYAASVEEKSKANLDNIHKKYQIQSDRINKNADKLRRDIDDIKNALEENSKTAISKLDALRSEEERLKTDLEISERRKSESMQRLEEEYAEKRAQVQDSIAKTEKETSEINERLKKELADKIREIEHRKRENADIIRETEKEYSRKMNSLALEIANMEKVLSDTAKERNSQDLEYNLKIKAKEQDILRIQKELKENELNDKKELNDLRQEMLKSILPLENRKKEVENRLLLMKREREERLSSLEAEIKSLRHDAQKQEEELSRRTTAEEQKLSLKRKDIEEKVQQTKSQIEYDTRRFEDQLVKLEETMSALRNEKLHLSEQSAVQKTRINAEGKAEMTALSVQLEHAEKQYRELRAKLDAQIAGKADDARKEKDRISELVAGFKEEFELKEKELLDAETEGYTEIANIKVQFDKLRSKNEKMLAEREKEINDVRNEIASEKARVASEMDDLKRGYSEEQTALKSKRDEIDNICKMLRSDSEKKISELNAQIDVLKSDFNKKESEFDRQRIKYAQKLASIKNDYSEKEWALREEKIRYEQDSHKILKEKEEELSKINTEYQERRLIWQKEKSELESRLNNEIIQLKNDINELSLAKGKHEAEYPAAIEMKNREISQLHKQLQDKEYEYTSRISRAERMEMNFRKRTEKRLQVLKDESEKVQSGLKEAISSMELKYRENKQEYDKHIGSLNDEIARVKNELTEEKSRLEKQKYELETVVKDTEERMKNEFRYKEKEFITLQNSFIEKQRAWEDDWNQKEGIYSQEKKLLVEEYEKAKNITLQEQEKLSVKLAEKEKEISDLKSSAEKTLENMTVEYSKSKSIWEENNNALAKKITELEDSFSALKNKWSETHMAKERELSALRSNIDFWEMKSRAEQEKHALAWEEERNAIEIRIKEESEVLEEFRKKSAIQLEEKQKALQNVKEQYEKVEKEKLVQVKEMEAKYSDERERLVNETESLKKITKEETDKAEKAIRELARELEKTKLESVLKDTVRLSDAQKYESKWRKTQRSLEEELREIRRKLEDEKALVSRNIKLRTEEINTLQVRMTLREERRQAEISRRQEETRRIVSALEAELKEAESKYKKEVPEKKGELSGLKGQLKALKEEAASKEDAWQKARFEKESETQKLFETFASELKKAEDALVQESRRYEELLQLKEKQVHNLFEMVKSKEGSLMAERDFTQEMLLSLRARADEIEAGLRNTYAAGRDQKEVLSSDFESAIETFNKKDFQKTEQILKNILKKKPDFAGAYQYLALCYWNMGNKAEAKKMAEKALELEPHNAELKLWIENIKENT